MYKIWTANNAEMNNMPPIVFHTQDIEDIDMWNILF